uniref:DDE Tnp4 domain-containing protein n=1 Tax=Romanomermis culicivorax TaxID=13658 RepID=A0A915LAY2_ROMCU
EQSKIYLCDQNFSSSCTLQPGPCCIKDLLYNKSNKFDKTRWRPFDGAILLADSGYGNSEYILTPLANPILNSEQAFNPAHKKKHRLIECAIGVLKQRFRCLGGKLIMKPEKAAEFVKCCTILHNFVTKEDNMDILEITEQQSDPNLDNSDNLRLASAMAKCFFPRLIKMDTILGKKSMARIVRLTDFFE